MTESKPKEMIKGGKAEGMNCEDLAKKHGVPLEDILEQEKKGIKIEHEHSPDDRIAAEISRDHLSEHPYYYDFLEDMEKEMETDYDNEEYGPEKEKEEESDAVHAEPTDSEIAKQERLKKLFG